MKRKRLRNVQVIDGDRFRRRSLQVIQCCHCGLVHIVRTRRWKDGLYETVWVDPKRTREVRRTKRYKGLRLPYRLRRK